MLDSADNRVLIYIDGDGVEPDTVDARTLLALASAFVGLLDKVAVSVVGNLPLRGLEVVPKCAAVAIKHAGTDDGGDDVARTMKQTLRVVNGDDEPPYGGAQYVTSLHRIIQHLPHGQRAGVQHKDWSGALALPIRKVYRAKSIVPMRLALFGMQDHEHPRLSFECSMQTRKIVLSATKEQADGLVPYWGKPIQATVAVYYNDKLEMTEGTLIDWAPLNATISPLDALRDIFLRPETEDVADKRRH